MINKLKYKMQLISILYAFISGNILVKTDDLYFVESASIDFSEATSFEAMVLIGFVCGLVVFHLRSEDMCNIFSEMEIVFEESKNQER